MRIVGVIASSLVVVAAVVAAAFAVKSVPDLKHYRRLRDM